MIHKHSNPTNSAKVGGDWDYFGFYLVSPTPSKDFFPESRFCTLPDFLDSSKTTVDIEAKRSVYYNNIVLKTSIKISDKSVKVSRRK